MIISHKLQSNHKHNCKNIFQKRVYFGFRIRRIIPLEEKHTQDFVDKAFMRPKSSKFDHKFDLINKISYKLNTRCTTTICQE